MKTNNVIFNVKVNSDWNKNYVKVIQWTNFGRPMIETVVNTYSHFVFRDGRMPNLENYFLLCA